MDYFELANEQYNSKNYYKAIDLYKKAVSTGINEASSLYNCAVCFIKLKNYGSAISLLKSAINKKEDSKYYFNLGFCFTMLSDNKKALLNFNRAWALDNYDEDCKKAIDNILNTLKK